MKISTSSILSFIAALFLTVILSQVSFAQGSQFVNAVKAFEEQVLNQQCVECGKVFDRRHCGECETSGQDLGVYTPIEKDDSTFNDTAMIVLPNLTDNSGKNLMEIHYSQSKDLSLLYDQIDSEIDKLQNLQRRILKMNQFLQLIIAKDAVREVPMDPGILKPVEEKSLK